MCRSPISPPISQFWYYSSLGEISCSTSYAFLLNSFDTPLSRAFIETTYADNGTRGNRPTRLGTCPGYHRRHTKTYKQQYRPPISQFPYYSSLGRNSLLYELCWTWIFQFKWYFAFELLVLLHSKSLNHTEVWFFLSISFCANSNLSFEPASLFSKMLIFWWIFSKFS